MSLLCIVCCTYFAVKRTEARDDVLSYFVIPSAIIIGLILFFYKDQCPKCKSKIESNEDGKFCPSCQVKLKKK